ncbi:MAG: chemotaxis protein CheB [Myxococcales bacterium]
MQRGPGPIRVVLMAEDEGLRTLLSRSLGAAGLRVVETVSDATSATRACGALAPDVVVIDSTAKASEGFAAVQDIMAFRPTPILLLTDAPEGQGAFEALALGALDVMSRPPPGASPEHLAELATRLRLLSGVKVITHVRGRRTRKRVPDPHDGPPIVGIAASLGGPRALAVLLKGLPRDLAVPICLVQHISSGFSQGLASWLASESGLHVEEAGHGEPLVAGRVYVAPTGAHLTIGANDEIVLDRGPAIDGFRPSATAMLASLARRYGRRAIGVVLTGMGRDGAAGLAAIRAAGGRTIAQDEATSVVYGMPRAAVEAGGVERVLPLDEIAEAIVGLVRQNNRTWGSG